MQTPLLAVAKVILTVILNLLHMYLLVTLLFSLIVAS